MLHLCRSHTQPFEQASTDLRLSAEVAGYRRASLPACQELARTRPWINYRTYSWFTAYWKKSGMSRLPKVYPGTVRQGRCDRGKERTAGLRSKSLETYGPRV